MGYDLHMRLWRGDAEGTGVDLHEKPLPVMPDELKKYFD